MRFHLSNNRSNFKQTYQAGLASQIFLPLNIGRYVGADNVSSLFKSRPNSDSVNLADWINAQSRLGNVNSGIYSGNGSIPVGGTTVSGDTLSINLTDTITNKVTTDADNSVYLTLTGDQLTLGGESSGNPYLYNFPKTALSQALNSYQIIQWKGGVPQIYTFAGWGNDATAASQGVAVGEVYFNTGTNRLVTRMT